MNPQFAQLVLSLQMGAMQQMGKLASPLTGKVERDLMLAQASIDMLSMLQEKMKGNLTSEEEKFIGRVLYELRMNYVDEANKPKEPERAEKEGETGGAAHSAGEPSESTAESQQESGSEGDMGGDAGESQKE
jgi:DNA replication initiation complex subunit (GINS family)